MTTIKPSMAFKTATPAPELAGIQELQTFVAQGIVSKDRAFEIVEARITKRIASGKKLIGHVVSYRNQLAAQLGKDAIPAPSYTNKAQPTSLDGVLKVIDDSGVSITELMAVLATRMNKSR